MELKEFRHKTALITGASSGIGKQLACQLAANGCNLILVARRSDRLVELKLDLEKKHSIKVENITLDLSELGASQSLFRIVQQKNINVDILINNAGNGRQLLFNEIALDEHKNTLDLNITALTELTHLFSTKMIENGLGYILLVGSVAGFFPVPNFASYSASKAYVNSLGTALNSEVRSQGVNVTVLNPGATQTEFTEKAGQKFPQLLEKYFFSQPEDVAAAGLIGLQKRKTQVTPGIANKLTVFLMRFVPLYFQSHIAKMIFR